MFLSFVGQGASKAACLAAAVNKNGDGGELWRGMHARVTGGVCGEGGERQRQGGTPAAISKKGRPAGHRASAADSLHSLSRQKQQKLYGGRRGKTRERG